MDDNLTMQPERQQELLQGKQAEVAQAADVSHERVRLNTSESRELMRSAASEIDRQCENVLDDMRGTFGPDVANDVKEVLDAACEVMDKAQEAASAFFRILEEGVKSAAADHQRLADISNGAAQTIERFAAEMQRQNELLTQRTCYALDNDDTNDAREAFRQAAEVSDALKDSFYKEIARLNEQLDAARQDATRKEGPREGPEVNQRHDERHRR